MIMVTSQSSGVLFTKACSTHYPTRLATRADSCDVAAQLEAEKWTLTEDSVELVLGPEKQKRPITVYLSDDFCTKFLVPSNVSASELTQFARYFTAVSAGISGPFRAHLHGLADVLTLSITPQGQVEPPGRIR
jgi:hypothetical protein